MNKLVKLVAAIALALILLAATATAGGLYSRFEQTNKNRKDNAQIWHAVICDIEQQVLATKGDPRLTPERKREFLRQYDRLLVKDAHAAPCRLVTGR